MNPKERERLVDDVLDRALGPQAAEPRPGFEERILANLPKEVERRAWWRWMWAPALAAAAVLAIVIGMRVMNKEAPAPVEVRRLVETPKQEVADKPEKPTLPTVATPIVKHVTPRVGAPRGAVTLAKAEPQTPRLETFPAPVPLTDQERLLLALSRRQRGEVEIAANSQSADRERAQKYFDTGYAPGSEPSAALNKR